MIRGGGWGRRGRRDTAQNVWTKENGCKEERSVRVSMGSGWSSRWIWEARRKMPDNVAEGVEDDILALSTFPPGGPA